MKKIILFLLALIPLAQLGAQENTLSEERERAAINTTWENNKFKDNWFFSLGGGISVLESEESRYLDFGDRFKPAISLSVGKWVSPAIGFRLNATGSKLQGFASWSAESENSAGFGLGSWYVGKNQQPFPSRAGTNSYMDVYGGSDPKNASFVKEHFLGDARTTSKAKGYDYDMKYMGASFDLLVNANNVFAPYNPKRFFEVVLAAGLSYTHTFKESSGKVNEYTGLEYERTAVNLIGLKFGIQPKFRLADHWDLFLEGQLLVVPEAFDRRVGDGNTMDGVYNMFAGLTYKFPAANKFNKPERVYIDQRPIVVPKDDCCDELRARLQRIEELLNKRPEQEPTKVVEKERLKVVVHFIIDKHDVRPSEMYKLDEIAAFMNKYPQVKVSVSGYADVQTAYPEYNMKLSERRANEVVRLLSSKYRIDKSRLSVKAFGDTIQPFDINNLNRAVIAFDID